MMSCALAVLPVGLPTTDSPTLWRSMALVMPFAAMPTSVLVAPPLSTAVKVAEKLSTVRWVSGVPFASTVA